MEIIDKSTWFTNANSANSAAAPEQPGLQTVLPSGGLVQLWLFIEESKMIFFWGWIGINNSMKTVPICVYVTIAWEL